MRRVWLCAVLAAIRAAAADQEVELSRLELAGSARADGSAVRLTSAERHQAGAAWLAERQPVSGGFDTTFQFRISEPGGLGGGADGFAFVLQNSGAKALGGRGSGGGFALGEEGEAGRGIARSIAVFFDTFRNEEIGDRSNNFVTICTAGSVGPMRWPPARLSSSKKLSVRLKDGKAHTARISYQPPSITVYLDGGQVLSAIADVSTVIGSDGFAWAGFTASTGEGYENHDILNWSFSPAEHASVFTNISFLMQACLPDRNLCTPEHAVVEESTAGTFHVVLPANSDAAVPNAGGHPVLISNARGYVCAANTCAGAAAMVQSNRDGKTWFSVKLNGEPKDRQGYLEFDVRVQ